jgi:hypothetical protein
MFIHKCCFIFFSICLGVFTAGAQINTNIPVPGHPRLLLLKGEEQKIKQAIATDKTWNGIHRVILKECDEMLDVAPVEHVKIGRRLLDKSRTCLKRVFYLSYAWRMTQDQKYLKRAEKELLAVAGFSDWNPSHFLDVAEMTMAVSIGYDWLYDGLSAQSRAIIKAAILKNGLEPSMSSDPANFWLKAAHNWNQVCNAGMTYGAIAVYEDNPTLSQSIINRAMKSVPLPMEAYGTDGAYPEGYGYWAYGTTFNVMFISALEKLYQTDFGLTKNAGFLKTGSFLENMTGPTGIPFNFFDSGSGGEFNPAMFWFANRLKDTSLLWVERNYLTENAIDKIGDDRLLPAVLLWGAGMPLNTIKAPTYYMWTGMGKNPLAIMRSSWTDPDAIYVGMKGGSPSLNHGHMDAGSFVMDADGLRWAMDFGMQGYESLESKGVDLWNMKQNSQRWEVLRYNNFVHNTLTINNELQQVDGTAPIVSHSNSPQFMNAITDLTSVYKNSISKALRGIALVDKKYVVVRDELETKQNKALLRWSLLTPANVKITGKNEAELTKNGKKLYLKVMGSVAVNMKTWSTEPTHDYDAKNPGTIVVGFEAELPANAKSSFTVLLIPEKSADQAGQKIKPLQQWPKAP